MSALAEALVAAQADLPLSLRRDADGQIGERGYRYVTFDALVEATRPILSEHGLAITQHVGEGALAPALRSTAGVEIAAPAWLHTTLHHTSGESLTLGMVPLLHDGKMQGLGAAITYARRYAWAAALGIASEEDDDAASVSNGQTRATSDHASEAQLGLIARLVNDAGVTAPDGPLTKAQAHEIIDSLKAGTYDETNWTVPF